MNISRIHIKGFRSLQDVEVNLSNYTTLIGKNDSGKSSFLKALQLLFDPNVNFSSEDVCKFPDHDGEYFVEATIENCSNRFLNLKNEQLKVRKTFGNKQSLSYLGKIPDLDILDRMSQGSLLKQELKDDSSLDDAVKEFILKSLEELCPKGRVPPEIWKNIYDLLQENNFIKYKSGWCHLAADVLSSIVQVIMLEADVRGEEEISGGSRSVLNKVGGILLREATKNYEGIADAVATLNEQITKVATRNEEGKWIIEEINNFESVLSQEVQRFDSSIIAQSNLVPPKVSPVEFSVNVNIRDEWINGLDKMGHGLRRSVVFAMLRTHRRLKERSLRDVPESGDDSPLYLFLVEEPELYLHPQAERRRKKELKELSEDANAQVVLCTHSAIFVDLTEYRGVLRFNRPDRKFSRIQGWTGRDLKSNDHKSLATTYKFDPNRSAMLFADLVILVEGQSERVAIPHIAEKMKLSPADIEVEVVDCGGNPNIPVYQMVLEGFGIKYVAWFDSDVKSEIDRAKNVRTADHGKIVITEDNWEKMSEIPAGNHKKAYRSWKYFIFDENEPNKKLKDRIEAAYNWQDFE